MYRYSVDNAITYTSGDLVLFMESPFACWMERLTLENPEHGIPPDVGSRPPADAVERQDDIAETLGSENKHVCLIDWDAEEPFRRSATVQAMRQGVDFIVNGQLSLGSLSGPANLLMRTSGYSRLGDYLYVPCDTQSGRARHAPFRLCFLSELLCSLQGQLPPQLLLLDGDDLVSLPTDDHIHHYRAVLQRFRESMASFRKHRMPEPSESAHFGRWGDCARELLKQRILRQEHREGEPAGDEAPPMRQVVGDEIGEASAAVEQADAGRQAVRPAGAPRADNARGEFGFRRSGAAPSGPTLAEQARMLHPPVPAAPACAPTPPADRGHARRASDAVLQNLEFIGITRQRPRIGDAGPPRPTRLPLAVSAPPPTLRDPRPRSVTPDPEPPCEWPIRTTGYVSGEVPGHSDGGRAATPAAGGGARGDRRTPAPPEGLRTGPVEDVSPSGAVLSSRDDRSPDVPRQPRQVIDITALDDPGPGAECGAVAPVLSGRGRQPPSKATWQATRRVTGQVFAPGPNVDLDSSLPVSPPTTLATAGVELPEEEIAVVEEADAAFEEYQRLRAKARGDAARSPGGARMTSDCEDD